MATFTDDLEKNDWKTTSLSVVVVGASGDLAKKKIFPALFALYYEGLLPEVGGIDMFMRYGFPVASLTHGSLPAIQLLCAHIPTCSAST